MGAIISDYKSVRACEVPLQGLTVLFGPNGVGKTNLLEAIGAYDPLARQSLARAGGATPRSKARIGLVTRFDTSSSGSDAETLRLMLVSPWADGMSALDITEGIGAYCGSTWWIDGGDLYDPEDQRTLAMCMAVISRSMLAAVPAAQAKEAALLVDLLLVNPTVVVQEDFAVELSLDRDTRTGQQALALARVLRPALPNGALSHVIGVLTSWTGRWPPLTVLTRGPAGGGRTPAGFGWVASQLGGMQVVSGDDRALESHLDTWLPRVHDRLMHRPEELGPDDPPADELCVACLHPDHGGRVDPTCYDPDDDDSFLDEYPGSSSWMETNEDWVRIRPSVRDALMVIELNANARMVSFVADAGSVVLDVRSPTEWEDGGARCSVSFRFAPVDTVPLMADWNGLIGVLGYPIPAAFEGPTTLPVADLGAGMRRWVAAAVRLAVDDLAAATLTDVAHSGTDVMPKVVLIDEPEQHLHPLAQQTAATWCLRESRSNHTMLVATHSPAFMALPPEAATLCQVSRLGQQTLVQPLPAVHGADVVPRARQLGFELGLGWDAIAQMTRAIVVVEGEWDRQMLHEFFAKDFAQQRILVVPLQGSDELGGMADAAVIPLLGKPVIALLDEVRAASAADLEALPRPLSKAERALRDLSIAMGPHLRFARYEDPDVICALPEAAVRRAFPEADFPGWTALLEEWAEDGEPEVSFKRWSLKRLGVSKKQRMPSVFFRAVLAHRFEGDEPGRRFTAAAKQVLALVQEVDLPR